MTTFRMQDVCHRCTHKEEGRSNVGEKNVKLQSRSETVLTHPKAGPGGIIDYLSSSAWS